MIKNYDTSIYVHIKLHEAIPEKFQKWRKDQWGCTLLLQFIFNPLFKTFWCINMYMYHLKLALNVFGGLYVYLLVRPPFGVFFSCGSHLMLSWQRSFARHVIQDVAIFQIRLISVFYIFIGILPYLVYFTNPLSISINSIMFNWGDFLEIELSNPVWWLYKFTAYMYVKWCHHQHTIWPPYMAVIAFIQRGCSA